MAYPVTKVQTYILLYSLEEQKNRHHCRSISFSVPFGKQAARLPTLCHFEHQREICGRHTLCPVILRSDWKSRRENLCFLLIYALSCYKNALPPARLPRRLRLLGVTDNLPTPHHGRITTTATPHMERDISRDKSPSRGRGWGWGQNYKTAQAVVSWSILVFPPEGGVWGGVRII